jgi:hypothetical protein
VSDTFFCGPLEVVVSATTDALHRKVVETLDLHNVCWDAPHTRVEVAIRDTSVPAEMVSGTLLVCARMHVDLSEHGLYATCQSGAAASYLAEKQRWSITVPRVPNGNVPEDVEDFVGLALTTSWRHLGWAPIHAAAVTKDDCCALLCAPSGGGKTTLTAALIRHGWRTLGDDKLLLRLAEDGHAQLAALVHTFNLHPHARQWFPEVGDLECLPRYSAWTEKRKLRIESIWPHSTLRYGQPTHLVQIARDPFRPGSRVTPLSSHDVLDVLLRQTVIPSDSVMAAQVLRIVVPTARQLRGVRLELGEDVYHNPDGLAGLAAALR